MANSLNDALNRIKNMANQGYADDNDSTSLTGAMSRILGDKYTDYQYKKAKDIYKQNESELNSYKSQRENLYKANTTPILNNQMNMPKYDSSIKLPTAGTNVAVETAKPIYEELNKASELPEIKKVQQNIKDTYKETAVSYDNYLNSKLANDDIGFIDKTLGPVISGVGSLLPSKYQLENEQGQKYNVQNYSERKQQKILESYNTKLGQIYGTSAYELGKIGATMVVNAAGSAIGLPGLGTATYFTDIFSDTYNRTLEEGHSGNDALLYATIGTASEAIVGKLIGGTSKALGMGSSELSAVISNKLTNKLLSNHPRLANALASAISEGNEEFVQEFIDKFASGIVLDKKNTKDSLNDTFSLQTLEDAAYSGLIGGITGAVSGSMNKNYYNKVKIKDKNGKVHTEIIESSTNLNRNSMNDNVNVINGQNVDTDVKEEKPHVDSNINNNVQENTNIDNKVNSDIYNNVVENTSISNSLINTTNDSKTAFKYMPTNDTKVNNLYQSASTSNFNNSPETIQLIDTATKLVKEKGYNILFDRTITNDNGESVNAKITTNPNNEVEIRINPDSKSAGEFLLVHEVSHAIKTNEMIELINDFASRNEKFAESVKEIETRYGKNLTSEEVFADVCAQLFGNEEFIQSLETKNTVESKNIIKQVYELLKHLLNKLKSEGRYRNFVQDLETKWKNAYRNTTMQQAANNLQNEKFHLSRNALNEVNDALNNKNTDINSMVKLRDYTPKQLVSVGVSDLPMLVRKGHLRENILTDTEANNKGYSTKGKHYHGLGIDTYMKAIDSLDEPIAVYQYTDKGKYSKDNFIVLTEVKDSSNNNIIVPIEIHKKGQYNKVEVDTNRIKTTYGRETTNYFNNMVKEGNLIEVYKKRSTKLPMQSGNFSTSVENNISQSNTNVNRDTSTKYSMQLNENNDIKEKARQYVLLKQQREELREKINKGGLSPEEYHNIKNQIKNLQEQRNELSKELTEQDVIDSKKQLELEKRASSKINGKSENKKFNEILNTYDKKIKDTLNNDLSGIEAYIEEYGISDSTVDELTSNAKEMIYEMYDNNEISDYVYEKLMDYCNNIVSDIMYDKGYEPYYKENKMYYSLLPKAKKSYDNILQYLDDNDLNYEISKSWNPGELPSVYIKNQNGDIFRIANHYNSKNPQFTGFFSNENKIYSTKDYINYKDTIINDLNNWIEENNTQELDNSSFSLDDKGRTLTKKQQEYFKDSKIRDKNGKLKTMYHGTRNDFTVFDINKSGESSQNSKVGFWFTENSDGAKNFANSTWYGNNKEAKSMEVYLNITNPKIYEEVNNNVTMEQLKKQLEDIKNQKKPIEEKYLIDSLYPNYSSYDGNLFLKYCAMYESKYSSYTQNEMLKFIKDDYDIKANENNYFNDVKKYSELLDKEKKIERQQDNLRYTDSYEQFRGDLYSIDGKDLHDANIWGTGIALNNEDEVIEKYVSKLKKEGYDGIIIKNTKYDTQTLGEKNTQYVAFYPSQIKNVDNTNPTSNEDIRYSQNNSKWQEFLEENFKSTGTRTYFKDVVLKNNEVSKSNTKYSENLNSNKSNDVLKVIVDSKTQKKLDQLDTELKNIKERYTKMYPNDKRQRDSKIKARIMEISAQKRNLIQGDWLIPIEKGLTSNELNNKINRLKSNYVGKEVIVDNNKGKVIGTSFGKIGVEFENGNTKYYDAADIKPVQDIDFIIKEQTKKYNQLITENKVDTTKKLNPIEISNLTENDATTTPKLSKTEDSKVGKGESHYWDNINEKTNMLSDDTKKAILSRDDIKYYKQITNKDSLNEAFDKLNKSGASETFRWSNIDSKTATATDVAEGWILLKQYNDAGDYDGAIVVAKKMKEMGTSAGQTVQAFNIMERMTPEGMVKYAQSELTDAYNIMVKNKTKEWIDKYKNDFDLQPNEVKFIVDTMKEVQNMEDGYSKKVKLAEIQKMMTDKLPPDKSSRIKSWMRISMLFNPKTQVRNVVGNALIMPVNSISDVISSKVDKIIAKKTGVRTTGTTDIKALLKGIKKGAYEATNDYKKGINTKDMDGNRFEISNQKSFSEKNLIGKSLNRTEALLNYVMDVGDRVFSEAAFENSLQNQMTLNNTTEVTQEMIDIAHTEALQRTWNDNNNYTKFVLDVRRGLNRIKVAGYGLGDVLIPFAKTPANLTKAIVDYSPAGLVSTITKGINLKNSLSNGQYTAKMQHQFVQSLGKATAGTMLYVLGIALAKAGITSGESDDDKDTRDFIKNALGISSYSIKIGDKSFTYDWAQPIAAPLSITANVVNSKKNKETALSEAIIGSLDTAGSILLEQSFLSSLNDVLSDNNGVASGIVNEVLELPSRAIPTFAKQIADLVDDTQRQTYEYNSPIKTAKNKIIAKLPGVSKTLSPSVDTMGREIKKYGGKSNIFNVFLNPANVNTKNISESAKEIYRLYKATGDQTIMPRVTPYYINQKGEKTILSTKERTEYAKVSGKIIEDNIKLLLKNSNYVKLEDEEKSQIIKNIVDYSYNKAREDVVGIEMSNAYNGVKTYTMANGQISDYYLTKKAVSDIKDKYKGDTTTMKNARKQEIFSYINKLNINKAEKTMLFGITTNYSIKNYRTYLFNYINKLNITKKEKEKIWKDLYGKD